MPSTDHSPTKTFRKYSTLPKATFRRLAKEAGLYESDDRILMLTGLDVWYYVSLEELKRDAVKRCRFLRLVFAGPTKSHYEHWNSDLDWYEPVPSPANVYHGATACKDLRQWKLVASNRTAEWVAQANRTLRG